MPFFRRRVSAVFHTVAGRLVALVLLMLVPISMIALFAAWTVYAEERQAVVAAAIETSKALSLVVDRELGERAAVLRTLAGAGTLSRGDLAGFYREAKAAVPQAEDSIMLVDGSGQQLFNTRAPFGTPDLPVSEPIRQLAEWSRAPGRPVPLVTGLYPSPLGKQLSFAVHVPITLEGGAPGYLAMGSFASQLQRIFEQQPLPEGWVGSLLDERGRLVARNVAGDVLRGRSATPDMLAAIEQAPSGFHETRTLDGVPVLTVYTRGAAHGWTVLIGLPQAELQRPALRALSMICAAALGLTLLASWVAWRIGRGIVGPVRRLHADALALGRGDPVPETPTGLLETDAVRRRLAQAARERGQAEQTLHAKVAEAIADTERAQRAALGAQKLEALGRLTGGIAHDFNNLLQTMTTGLQLARTLALGPHADPRARNALDACDRAVSKAVQLTRQLMTFGRAQPGHLEVIALPGQLEGLRDLLKGALRDNIAVSLEVAPETWPVRCDPVQFELAVLNMTLNARDAMPPGRGGTIVLRADNRVLQAGDGTGLPAGDYVRLEVEDDGAGIAPEVLQRIFEPFFTTKPVGKGSGLGLAQVYGFAAASGGTVTADSSLGHGTRMVVWLPRSPAGERPAAAVPEPPAPARYHGTVLLVEDDALVRGLVAEGLQRLGFSVVVASNADDALALARHHGEIDVVLSDVVMPGGQSGLDLLKTLRVVRPALPVLLASGYADALGDEVDVPVLAKPYRVEQVAERLRQAMRGASLPAG
jgi:signal transduction histidine kinase